MSLGKDLASIRKEQGLTLEEIQSSIKIPLHILKSIENDSIFDHPEHNQTYIRSFIRSYAKALKIEDKDIVDALDSYEAGIYNHDLLESPDSDAEPVTEEPTLINEGSDEPEFDLTKVTPPEIKEKEQKAAPNVENVNWADMGKRFSLQDSGSKVKVVVGGIFIFIVILFGFGYYFWDDIGGWFDFSDPEIVSNTQGTTPPPILDEQEEEPETTNESESGVPTQLPETPPTQNTPEEVDSQNNPITGFQTEAITQLGDTLTAIVYAAYDKLEPVRVTSDFNGRTNPFWMEQGQAFKFDFRDSLLVRGQYSRMLLLFNGHVIENPTNEYFDPELNSVLLTRSALESSNYLDPAPAEFPYDVQLPDSVVYRIRY